MSIILDALKKSETERHQHGQTEFGQVPMRAPRRRTPVWVWIVAALLAINLIVLVSMLMQSTVATTNAPASQSVAAPAPVAAAPAAAVMEDDASFAEQLEDVQPLPEPTSAAASTVGAVNVIATPQAAPKATVVEAITGRSASVPDIDQLRASGELSIGEQRLDIHVFSEAAENRFVFINMTKLREGATTNDGVTVEEITADGVILSYQGRRFFQARQ